MQLLMFIFFKQCSFLFFIFLRRSKKNKVNVLKREKERLFHYRVNHGIKQNLNNQYLRI